jgi:hypothetical protein
MSPEEFFWFAPVSQSKHLKRRGSQCHRSESPHVAYNETLRYDPRWQLGRCALYFNRSARQPKSVIVLAAFVHSLRMCLQAIHYASLHLSSWELRVPNWIAISLKSLTCLVSCSRHLETLLPTHRNATATVVTLPALVVSTSFRAFPIHILSHSPIRRLTQLEALPGKRAVRQENDLVLWCSPHQQISFSTLVSWVCEDLSSLDRKPRPLNNSGL